MSTSSSASLLAAAALAAGVVSVFRSGVAAEIGAEPFTPYGGTAGLGLEVTPGPAVVIDQHDVEDYDLNDVATTHRVEVALPVTLTLVSNGVSLGDRDDPWLDEVTTASAALAMALRQVRSFDVGGMPAHVDRVEAASRGGFRETAGQLVRYEASWSTTLSFEATVEAPPEGFASGDLLSSLTPGEFLVEAATTP